MRSIMIALLLHLIPFGNIGCSDIDSTSDGVALRITSLAGQHDVWYSYDDLLAVYHEPFDRIGASVSEALIKGQSNLALSDGSEILLVKAEGVLAFDGRYGTRFLWEAGSRSMTFEVDGELVARVDAIEGMNTPFERDAVLTMVAIAWATYATHVKVELNPEPGDTAHFNSCSFNCVNTKYACHGTCSNTAAIEALRCLDEFFGFGACIINVIAKQIECNATCDATETICLHDCYLSGGGGNGGNQPDNNVDVDSDCGISAEYSHPCP